jgi:hypothetical protein
LASFENFSGSAVAQQEIMGLLKVNSTSLADDKKLNNEILAEIASCRTKWLQLYTSRTGQTPSSPVGKNT